MNKLRQTLRVFFVILLLTVTTALFFPFSGQSANKVSFFFDDADIYEVIQTVFGDLLKANYIIDSQVKGTVSIKLSTPVELNKLLPLMEVILRLNGIGIVESDGIYTIIPLTDVIREPSPIFFGNDPKSVEPKGVVIVQIIPIENTTSTDLMKTLTPFTTKGAAIMDMPEHNFLLISDIDKNVKRILEIINIFDEAAFQDIIRPDIYVYSLKNSRADNVAQILQELFLGGAKGGSTTPRKPLVKTIPKTDTTPRGIRQPTTTPSRTQSALIVEQFRQQLQPKGAVDEELLVAPGTKIFHDEASNSIIILATKKDYKLIEETIKKIDLIPRQVLIEVMVADIDLTDELRYGVEWFIKAGDNRFGFGTDDQSNTTIGPLPSSSQGVELGLQQGFTYFNRGSQFTFLLRALANEGKVKILASPHIIASDNNEAKIQIGTEEPVITQNQDVGTGADTRVVQNVQYRDTGIILTVKPQINEGGLISMDVKTEESRVNTSLSARVGGSPPFFKTEALTNLIVQDGETIVIGGLIQERKDLNEEGIPWLSKIPWLGVLFRSQREETRKRELMISLTPRVIRDTEESDIVSKEFMDKLHVLTDELDIKERTIPDEKKSRFWQPKARHWQKETPEKE